MKLVINHFPYNSFNDFDLHECEQAILSDSIVKPASKPSFIRLKFYKTLSKLLSFLKFIQVKSTSASLFSLPLLDKEHLFSLLIGPDFDKYIPYCYFTFSKRSIYIFDAWPCHFESIVSFTLNQKIDHLFITSSQATDLLKKKLPFTNIHWIPEAIDPDNYKFSNEKSIDVLSFGRKYDTYHDIILPFLSNNNYTYLFEKVKGEVVFQDRSDFINGLANSKISICFPSNITHPERSGNIEIMTMRYLQSIVSKCLIVGQAPKEMIYLFGYNPVIEVDWKDPENQISYILNNYKEFGPLIEKNYLTVLNNHTWIHRWDSIKNTFQK